jgi:hypothetical protein
MLPILVALIETLGMLGPALRQEVLGWIVQTSGWRTGMLVCGWFGLLLFQWLRSLSKTLTRLRGRASMCDHRQDANSPKFCSRPVWF